MLNYNAVARDLRQRAAQLSKAADALSGIDHALATKHVDKVEHKARVLSAAARKRISIAQKRRWAKVRRHNNVVAMKRAA